MIVDAGAAPAIELRGVTKRFGAKVVLDDVDLEIPRGRTTALLGPSGTGKSTLLRLATGLARPDAGVVRVLGEDVAALDRKRLLALRRRFGMLFQDGALFGSLTVGENVAFPLARIGGARGEPLRARVDELLTMVGLQGYQERMPEALSGGQRKRVALARAIALEPDLVLFDEPTSGLDPQTSASIEALVRDMQARLGITFVVITHDVHSAAAIAHHAGLLLDGKVRVFGRLDDVWRSPDPAVRAFLERKPLA